MPEALDESDFRRLVASARWGDDHAWRTLVEHWTPRLFAFLHSRCRDPELSEELVQDVFVKVAQRLTIVTPIGREGFHGPRNRRVPEDPGPEAPQARSTRQRNL